ncbi:hypothetical protein ONZ45_g13537 [Pleurotus djamor]|nr:hypothetical protein ONZ45_g13537 [Pleurotus djamor]
MIAQIVPADMDLCEMLMMMKLAEQQQNVQKSPPSQPNMVGNLDDVDMSDDPSYQSDTGSESSTSSSPPVNVEFYGCAYLQAVQAQMDNFPDSGKQYLDTIFAHRDLFMSSPHSHGECSRGFSDMAYLLEQRAWKEERAPDTDAVAAFRHEAWTVAMSLRDVSSKELLQNRPKNGSVCVMAPM